MLNSSCVQSAQRLSTICLLLLTWIFSVRAVEFHGEVDGHRPHDESSACHLLLTQIFWVHAVDLHGAVDGHRTHDESAECISHRSVQPEGHAGKNRVDDCLDVLLTLCALWPIGMQIVAFFSPDIQAACKHLRAQIWHILLQSIELGEMIARRCHVPRQHACVCFCCQGSTNLTIINRVDS